ncbi:resolvase [Saccharobesus litoralis]|uniref:Resolvase n=1 Tax=Saccharobesus litoralis TaxID=2172099 RepID=A0A2S0VUQ1_9ALTE|nr:recombinase family protein [Saccharobesus litoralis]AWB67892.1 resolvase [Saccharobesus litoralis]
MNTQNSHIVDTTNSSALRQNANFEQLNSPVLISYIRFSTIEQQKGQSLDRQLKYATEIAKKKGMKLEENLTIKDLGLSAYHKTNVTKGGLGLFLDAVKNGNIPPKSVLVIESLDRISRAAPVESQAIVTQIINAGITVITAIDGKEYDRETIANNPMDLIYIILIMIRAHEESDIKSKRVLSKLLAQCKDWQDGKRGFRVKCGKAPKWVKWCEVKKEFIFEPREKAIMLRKIQLFNEGHGGLKIAEIINSEFGSGTVHHTGANVYKEVKRRTLIGENNVNVDGQDFCLKGYYPSLITISEFNNLVNNSSSRGTTKHRQKFVGILSGIDVFKCGGCGKSVKSHITYRQKKAEKVPKSHKRYGCVEASRNNNCNCKETFQLDAIEKAVVTYCSDTVNLVKVLNQSDVQKPLIEKIDQLKAEQDEIKANIDYLIEASMKTRSASLAEKLHSLENDLNVKSELISNTQTELQKLDSSATQSVVEQWKEKTKNLEYQSNEERRQLRLLIKDTFKFIILGNDRTINKKGVAAAIERAKEKLLRNNQNNYVDLTFKFHNGLVRTIRLDKYSGELISGFDLV